MKKIAYLITDAGIDGRESETIISAFWSEEARNEALAADKSKAWRSTRETIVDTVSAKARAFAKLNGIDRLALDLPTMHTTNNL